MKKLFYVLLGLVAVIFLAKVSLAAEHPGTTATSEHPGAPAKAENKEHPGTTTEVEHKEHPGMTHEEEHPGEQAMLSAEQIIKGIKDHINKVTEKNNGYFPLRDTQEGKDLKLKLIRVHEDRVSYIKKDDAYFACTDFKTDDGKATYDIDFWMKMGEKRELEVYKTKIHKKDGKPRFTYQDDEIVPVESSQMMPEEHPGNIRMAPEEPT